MTDDTIRCCASCQLWKPNGDTEFGQCRNSTCSRFGQYTHGARVTCKGHRLIPFEAEGLRARLIEDHVNPPVPVLPDPPIAEPEPEPDAVPEEPPPSEPDPIPDEPPVEPEPDPAPLDDVPPPEDVNNG